LPCFVCGGPSLPVTTECGFEILFCRICLLTLFHEDLVEIMEARHSLAEAERSCDCHLLLPARRGTRN
jgi:hypothetical protein